MFYNKDVENQYVAQITAAVDARSYDQALALITQRNSLIWQERGGKKTADITAWDRIRDVVTKDVIDARKNLSSQGQGIVFIVGMPRAGKTTLETLLSGIKGVQAAGELSYLSSQYAKVQDPNGDSWEYPDYIPYIPTDVWEQFGKAYCDPMRSHFEGADFIIDTMPPNFRFLGFLRMALPKAKVLHMRRSPFEHCLDMFSKKFEHDFYNYTYHLDTLSEFYVSYRKMMDHWSGCFGEWYLDVKLENVLSNPKKQIKKVLSFCEIEADQSIPALLQPHQEMLRNIDYSNAVLKNYRPYLKDFEKSLGQYKTL